MNDRRKIPLSFEPAPSEFPRRVAYHALRWLPLVVLALLTYALYPATGGFDAPVLAVDEVAQEDVVAPFDFGVPKTPAELTREADALAATVRPIYAYHQEVVDSIANYIDSLFTALDSATSPEAVADSADAYRVRLTTEESEFLLAGGLRGTYRQALDQMVSRELVRGVASPTSLSAETAREVIVRRNGSERVVHRDSVPGWVEFLERRRDAHPSPNSSIGDQIFVKLLYAAFRPTLLPSAEETEAARDALRADVDSIKYQVRQNERIIGEHEVVTTEAHERLVALRNELIGRGGARGPDIPAAIGQILANVLILSIFWLLLTLYRRESYGDLRHVLVVGLIFGAVVVGASINLRFVSDGAELIPVPFAAMLLTVLFSGRVAMIAAVVLAVLLGSQPVYGGVPALYITLVGGVAAALGIRVVRRRTQILVTMVVVSAAFAVAALSLGLQLSWTLAELGGTFLRGAINAVASAALVSIALPVFERLSRVTTDLTLLELSDPTHSLMRRLATEAPGTYAHSIAMANLTESACNAIGANGLLARVGCYYHDVGKVKKPQFFVENQPPGANPHDKLKPDVSATIIRNHVKEGLALAEEAGLPEAVKSFIPEHHGTAEITYFLDRARSKGADEPPAEQYRYPGPRPRSVETAVTMIADGVEAAIRVLDDPTPEKIRGVIDHIVRQRVEAGQLNEAPLTLAQLDRVKEEFARVLTGMHHTRIDYPEATGGIAANWNSSATE